MVCDIGEIMKLFLYIVGTSLPCYLFFTATYIKLKKISPDGDISKRFYDNASDRRETKLLNKVDNFMNLVYKNFVYYMYHSIIALLIIVIVITTQNIHIISYILSDAALRFQKYLLDTLLTIVIAVIGSVAIFSSFNKDYYVFFKSKDIINIFNVKQKTVKIFIYYISCAFFAMTYYFCHYIIEDVNTRVFVKLTSFSFFAVSAVVTFYYICTLLLSVITFLFSNKAEHKSLDLLYKRIYTKSISNLHIQKVSEIDSSIYYLLSNLNTLKTCDEKISFISFLNEFENFPQKIKNKNLCKTTSVFIIFNIIIAVIVTAILSQNGFDFIKMSIGIEFILSITFSILFNTIVCHFLYKTPLSQLFIHLNMWTWGFMVETGKKKYYSSIYSNRITKNSFDNYFRKLYSILCAFSDIISTTETNSIYCLHKIIEGINCGCGDYLLYIVSLFLYSEKYKLNKSELLSLKQYIEKNNIDWQMATHNTIAIIEDIERKNLEHEVHIFIEQVKNSTQKVKIKKI